MVSRVIGYGLRTNSMVKVLFFANLRELANTDSIELELGKARIVRDLLETMSSHFPADLINSCLLYTSPSPRDRTRSRMPSSA